MRTGRPPAPSFEIGHQFQHIRVIGKEVRPRRDGTGTLEWFKCICQCGATLTQSKWQLRRNPSVKCKRCAGIEAAKKRGADGRSFTPEWLAWKSARERCTRKTHPAYARYGARGISVCKRWESFDNFLANMGPRPSPKHSLERRDNHKGYTPANCVWATQQEQNNNTRANRILTVGEFSQTMAQWARELGGSPSVVANRLLAGWTVEAACTTPVRFKRKKE